jgi:hypothetical protein
MFRRLFVEDWQRTLVLVSFTIFFVVFAVVTIRALCMPASQRRHLENLPLDPDHDPHEHA